jgi:hypothetical protein
VSESVCVCMYVCMYVRMYIYVCIYVCMYVCNTCMYGLEILKIRGILSAAYRLLA